ncbi:MAG: amidase [Terriglobales bacterium]
MNQPENRSSSLHPNRRTFLKTAAAAAAGAAMIRPALATETPPAPWSSLKPAAFNLEELTIAEMQKGLASGKFTARSLAEGYLARIDALDKRGPAVNAVIEINKDALQIADALDKDRGKPRGPLHGIPVLIKDNIGTHDRMMTTAGSLALLGSTPPKDSTVAAKLRAAGAVILGKTNLSEWANIRSNRSTSGWSGRGGQTRNPYALDRNPCGSSSGSGVAVSANLCAAAVGTETSGSIICPSTTNGIVGIKPTVGLVSRSVVIPISHTHDTAGPMARTVADAAALLTVLAGYDPEDSATEPLRDKPAVDYTRSLDPSGLRGARIGVLRKNFGFSDAVDRLMEDALAEMKRQGAVLIDPVEVATTQIGESILEVFLTELKADLNAYLASLGPSAPVHSLKEVIEFNEKHRREEMPYFGQDLFEKAEEKGPLTNKDYLAAMEKNRDLSRTKGIDAAMDKNQLDAIVGPSGGPAWTTDLLNGDRSRGGSSGLPAAAGYPHITVPAGFVYGLPVGISFFGRAWSEAVLIKIAYAFEQATHHRKPPRFAPTADLTV